MDPFIGALMCVAFDYPPKGWAKCDGSLLRSLKMPLFSRFSARRMVVMAFRLSVSRSERRSQ